MRHNELPAPLVPEEIDLHDFRFMPLDCVRLRESEVALRVSGDEFRCAVMLWAAAWHQLPAGSLPDDDAALCHLAGYGRAVQEWMALRKNALWGFVKCSDGRLYHPVVCEKAREAWESRLAHRAKREEDRRRKRESREQERREREAATSSGRDEDVQRTEATCPADATPMSGGQQVTVPRTEAECPPENALTLSLTEERTPLKSPRKRRGAGEPYSPEFEEVWDRYPLKVGKEEASRAWEKARKHASLEEITAGLERQLPILRERYERDPHYCKHFSSWLNGMRWQDELPAAVRSNGSSASPDHDQWRARLSGWHARGSWVEAWGPKPNELGCEAPAELLADIGIGVPAFLKRNTGEGATSTAEMKR